MKLKWTGILKLLRVRIELISINGMSSSLNKVFFWKHYFVSYILNLGSLSFLLYSIYINLTTKL